MTDGENEVPIEPGEAGDNPFASAREDIRRMATDGSLRSDIDSLIDDPDLAVN